MIKVAIGSNDKIHISEKHFGMRKFFVIFEVDENNSYRKVEERENPYGEGKHKHVETEEIMEVLKDCDVFIGKSMGKESQRRVKEEWNKTPIVAKNVNTVEEAMEIYCKNSL
ncbi:dinitrogenase iron-molybdenum cofactor biosynthesis protein [Caldanaerobacter subterraneus subsp. yonseiensis KB-1]|uniref:Dinitrogenase iron-molybdenum cofactor biosynthesis protein n=1 Tax=Caldanaerobacter subterraneus subsp. yonseiensis KB-1 TaxID=1388761 RepID=U5CTL9_CALSX|nr:NifB/NifX family molybdenum-iron cluster-binding protein [Caldanaerobacter subterraneus]ERM93119.1 dinitrogenase iron-molybdenum cofactor biosynthesis protein [Caldanaerobacter subterraneus subsp. yonseiensis KB-1]